MIHKLLVPTDGSPLSQRVMPLAMEIASAQHAQIELVQIVQYLSWLETGLGADGYVDPDVYQKVMDSLDLSARKNLQDMAASARQRGIPVEETLLHGAPGFTLLAFEADSRPDLVVIATHGRTGLARFALGSVADLLIREGSAPVLVARSFGPQPKAFERALVPLDGSSLAEDALPMVEALAHKPLKHVHLFRVVDTADERLEALAYLQGIAARLRTGGVEISVGVAVGQADEAIATVVDTDDVVIMATHGRGGYDRFRHGSVAQRALHELTQPILLVRAGLTVIRQDELATAASNG